MGYYTAFKLTVTDSDGTKVTELVTEYVNEQLQYNNMFDYDGDQNSDPVKWYNYENDMKKISKSFKEYLFILEGVGEEHPDYWKAYFKNGSYYRDNGVVAFPPFDETKLS